MKQLINEQRGAVAIIVAFLMFVLLGFAAFAVDFGYLYGVKNELQNAADAAALAGASVLFSDNQIASRQVALLAVAPGWHWFLRAGRSR